jgi:uncharacterized protein (DUF1697 family)
VNRVALLRGVNNVGSRRVAMDDLRELFAKLGFAETKTLLNSGNILFYYRRGIADSKFRHGWDGTARNWNTVLKLIALLS